MQLGHVYTLEKNYFYMYSRYTTDLDLLGYEQPQLVPDGGNANYRIEIIEADEKGFRAKATALVDFDGDGTYNAWEIDQDKQLVEVTKD
ncbi:MAG: type IV pilin protein [Prevotellaceae bacterium]|nr:type IV pilin protein [Prevotellaceae bacterium]